MDDATVGGGTPVVGHGLNLWSPASAGILHISEVHSKGKKEGKQERESCGG